MIQFKTQTALGGGPVNTTGACQTCWRKVPIKGGRLIFLGREFHSIGAMTEKALRMQRQPKQAFKDDWSQTGGQCFNLTTIEFLHICKKRAKNGSFAKASS